MNQIDIRFPLKTSNGRHNGQCQKKDKMYILDVLLNTKDISNE
jgi:hypothetical protein